MREFTAWTRQFPATVALKAALNVRGLKTGAFHVPLTAAKQIKLEEFREWFQGVVIDLQRHSAHA